MNCPKCGVKINPAELLGKLGGKSKSRRKSQASRENGKLGGRPKIKKG